MVRPIFAAAVTASPVARLQGIKTCITHRLQELLISILTNLRNTISIKLYPALTMKSDVTI